MQIFIAGIIQGSLKDESIHTQDYRELITQCVKEKNSDYVIIDPHIQHPERFEFNLDQQKDMFIRYAKKAGEVDLLIAYLPEASMGTAIEIWEAYCNGVPILTVTPLNHNWVAQTLSTRVFDSLDHLLKFILEADLESFIGEKEKLSCYEVRGQTR
jgi:hypothetical protein